MFTRRADQKHRGGFRIGPMSLSFGILVLGILFALSSGCASQAGWSQLIVCGGEEVFILDISRKIPQKVWSWKAADRPELPESMRDKYATTDECKPLDGGARILVTASSSGVALIERKTGKVEFYATVPNAHSAERLPGDRIVVASSHTKGGDRFVLFDISTPDREIFHTEERLWPHGVVWDSKRQLLWALAQKELVAYKLADWDTEAPSLAVETVYPLPEGMGHDLLAVPGTEMLSLTTSRHCWLFDRDSRQILPHPQLADERGVKCISTNPATGQILWILSEKSWWTETLRFLEPEKRIHMPGEIIYKARWFPVEVIESPYP